MEDDTQEFAENDDEENMTRYTVRTAASDLISTMIANRPKETVNALVKVVETCILESDSQKVYINSLTTYIYNLLIYIYTYT